MNVTRQARDALAIAYSNVVTWAWDVATGVVDAEDDFRTQFFIKANGGLTVEDIITRVHPDDIVGLRAALDETVEHLKPYDFHFRVCDDAGNVRWLRGQGQVHEATDFGRAKTVIGVNYDISDEIEAAERLDAIAQEMRHRIKNSLAMVNSLAAVTAREHDDIELFMEHFRGRVEALASAQNIEMSPHMEDSIDLRHAIDGALAPFTASSLWRSRFSIDITTETVDRSLAQVICLVLYELGTNAVKYGALRFDDGSIDINAVIDADALVITWLERHDGTEQYEAADGTGFGRKLIARLISSENGRIEVDSEDGRYNVKMTFDL